MERLVALGIFLALCGANGARAQWVEESYQLKAGWNGIWLSQDASHGSIDQLFPATVEEVWRWNPVPSPSQFTESPQAPVQPDTQWLVWKRGFPADTTLTELVANSAYLVKVADGTATFTHSLRGKAVPPRYVWKSSGVNFVGFPTKSPETNFAAFFSYSDQLATGTDIFKYVGGPITLNPEEVLSPLFEEVTRGGAYWVRTNQFTDYYGPLKVTIASRGLDFGDTGSQFSMRIQNVAGEAISATLSPLASLSPPAGEVPSAGSVPLRLRGELDPGTGQFTYSDLSGPTSFPLVADEEIELIFAVDRAAMGGAAGDVHQSILRLGDSLGLVDIALPVRAVTTSRAGLWVGSAMVTQVDRITAAPGPELPGGEGSVEVEVEPDADAPASFPLRLILHRDEAGTTRLLQRVFVGDGPGGVPVISAEEALLDGSKIASAVRLSSSSFPLGLKEIGSGADLGLTGTATFSPTLEFDAPTNPFVHTFHPDHDNKDAQFNPTLTEGKESYTVERAIRLEFVADPAVLGLSELGWGSTTLGGFFSESVSGLRAQDIQVKGAFVLRRVSDIGSFSE